MMGMRFSLMSNKVKEASLYGAPRGAVEGSHALAG
jgi:hypothetical protein